MAVKGHVKGGAFERKISKRLSLWVTGKPDDVIFWRTASSGGRATQSLKSGIKQDSQVGDIGTIHPDGVWFQKHFIIECKSYKNLELVSFLFKKGGLLKGFWEKLHKESETYKRIPLLIGKQNFIPEFIMCTAELGHSLPVQPFLMTELYYFMWLEDFLKFPYKKFKTHITERNFLGTQYPSSFRPPFK